ncbi:THO complex subunit 4, partial [Lecanoromycetidae sp. Uapishka_2]
MSNKLDKSLDEILTTRRTAAKKGGPRGRGRRAPNGTRAAATAPAGGIQKKARTANGITKAAPNGPAGGSGESKIIVSNLPSDVNEQQIKEYFGKSIGPVRRAMLTYGPNGISRGVATIIFNKPDSAKEALAQLNGLKVDSKAIRIEIVINAANAQTAAPVKGLSDRVTKTQSKPAGGKPVTNGAAARGGEKTRGRAGRRGRNAGRPKPKTADELDVEMSDYFNANAQNAAAVVNDTAAPTNGTGQSATDGMDDIS